MTTQTRMIRATKAEVTMPLAAPKSDLKAKVDEYAKLTIDFQEQEKAFKESTKAMKSRLDTLKAELTETAKELETTTLDGNQVDLEFQGRNTRVIKCQDLFVYFKKLGQTLKFFDYIKVQITSLEKDMGKSVVEASGLVENEFDPYSSIKIKPRMAS